MEENIHDDKLDDYVRKSFEGHEEDPPSDMWDRVEGDLLPSTEILAPRSIYLRYGWQAAAAVVILVLFSTLVCEHLYYEEKLRDLAGKPVEQQEILSKSKITDKETGHGTLPNTYSQPASPGPNLPKPNLIKSNLDKSSKPDAAAATGSASKARTAARSGGAFAIQKSKASVSQGTQGLGDNTNSTPSSDGAANMEDPSVHPMVEPNAANTTRPKNIAIGLLPISRNLLEGASASSPVLLPISIKPVHHPSGWYVGAQASLLSSIDKSRTPISRPGRPAFLSKQERAQCSTILWFRAGKKLNNNLSLESGIGYQNTTRTATHTPRFRFGDGIHQGPLLTRRTFNYDLSTYGGTAEVSLRMEQTTPGSPVPDDEPVALKITTTQQTEMLRIPMLAAYQFGNGRWKGQLKAGLLGNFVLKNELDISARVSQNARLQPVMGSDGFIIRMNQKKFFLGYWLSAGAEFKLNKRLSLIAESVFVGDFPRNDPYSRRLPQRFMLGLNVGTNFYF